MNATPNSRLDLEDNGSDTDTNPDEGPEYYQPISSVDHDQASSDEENHDPNLLCFQQLPNGNGDSVNRVENGFSSLGLNGNIVERSGSEEGEAEEDGEDETEESTIQASNTAIRRAFMEDENRRNAPLSPENATRVIEAMRGISFEGVAPDWARRVPEDRWIDQLQRIRQPSDLLPPGPVQN